jgi:hypothetical protein
MSTPDKPAELPTFVLRMPTTFWWPVRIPTAADGDYTVAVLDVLFACLPQPELDKMLGKGLGSDEKLPTEEQIFDRVVKGWRNLPDENGDQVPYSAENRDRLAAHPMARAHIVASFMAASTGMAARKNA